MDKQPPDDRQALQLIPDSAAETAVDVVICGHLTRDLVPSAPQGWRVGGAALYAAVTARRLGLSVGVVTSAPPDVIAAAQQTLADVAFVVVPCVEATTYENLYGEYGRRQYVRAVATSLFPRHVPVAWHGCKIALLAPVADEVHPALADVFDGAVVGAAPQGWLRQWDGDETNDPGRVRPRAPSPAVMDSFARLHALVLSREDLTGGGPTAQVLDDAEETLREWARRTRLLVVTRASEGADVYAGGNSTRYLAAPAHEVDPTGAGDVFAMSLLWALAKGYEPGAATTLANRVAALSVEGEGSSAIPTLAMLRARYPDLVPEG